MGGKAKKNPDRWLIVGWNNEQERSPRLWSVDEEGKVLLSEAAALKLVKTIDEYDNVMVSKVTHNYRTRRVMERMK